jgi:hypothetical protein
MTNRCNGPPNRCNRINQLCTNFVQIVPEPFRTQTIIKDLTSVVTDDLEIKLKRIQPLTVITNPNGLNHLYTKFGQKSPEQTPFISVVN